VWLQTLLAGVSGFKVAMSNFLSCLDGPITGQRVVAWMSSV
jgi:hypothetical protein